MANIIDKRVVRKGTRSKLFVVEKIGDKYCAGRHSFGGLDAGWRMFTRLAPARKYMNRVADKERDSQMVTNLRVYSVFVTKYLKGTVIHYGITERRTGKVRRALVRGASIDAVKADQERRHPDSLVNVFARYQDQCRMNRLCPHCHQPALMKDGHASGRKDRHGRPVQRWRCRKCGRVTTKPTAKVGE